MNQPWSADAPQGEIQTSDLWLIAAAIIGWLVYLTMTFDGGTNAGRNWDQDEQAFAENVRLGIQLSTGAYVVGLAGLFALAKLRGYSLQSLMINNVAAWLFLLAVPAWFLFRLILSPIMGVSFGQPGMSQWINMLDAQDIAQRENLFVYFLFWMVVVFLRPMAMQIVFRGWVFGWLRVRTSFWFATLITSLLSASVYMAVYDSILEYSTLLSAGVWAFYFVAFSAMLCLFSEVSRSIWPGMLVSVLFPLIALSMG